ncbi:MAG TPA: hypothetical protein VFG45_13180 [Candidatus Nitrosocosmicus sp.]|nr:hypothetical protein [Candidatus Nitrosocosmicus sp.]
MSVSVDPDKPNYIGLINESVHTIDDQDIGDIYAINKYFLVVKRGYINVHFYYIPIVKVEGWDGHVLWLNITESEISKYEKDIFPHPLRYYVKGFIYEGMPPPVAMVNQIPTKLKTFDKVYSHDDKEQVNIYKCDLCGTLLTNENEYKNHILDQHQ